MKLAVTLRAAMKTNLIEVFNLADRKKATETRYFSLGRYALAAGLQATGIGKGHFVLMPEFICRDLLASIYAVGAEPIFYSVDKYLAPVSLHVAPNIKAILAVNYFGFPQNLAPFHNYCAEHGVILIEDNAHGFLSCDELGVPLGSRGDLGIASLRKTFALPDGAALLVNRKDLFLELPAPLLCRDNPLPLGYVTKNFLRQFQNLTDIHVRTFAEKIMRTLRWMRTGYALPISRPESEYKIPGEPAIHCESLRMLEKIDVKIEVTRRRDLYHKFHRDLQYLDIEPIFSELPQNVVPYGYPFRASKSVAATVIRFAQKKGFDCSSWPDLPSAVLQNSPVFYHNVWWVNFLC